MPNKLGLVMKRNSRAEVEASRTDDIRFQLPEDYTTEESLQYFQDGFNRCLFKEYFFENGTFSNNTMLAFAEVATPDLAPKWKVGKPVNKMWELHRKECWNMLVNDTSVNMNAYCQLYYTTMVVMASHVKSGFVLLHQINLQSYFSERLMEKLQIFKR